MSNRFYLVSKAFTNQINLLCSSTDGLISWESIVQAFPKKVLYFMFNIQTLQFFPYLGFPSPLTGLFLLSSMSLSLSARIFAMWYLEFAEYTPILFALEKELSGPSKWLRGIYWTKLTFLCGLLCGEKGGK